MCRSFFTVLFVTVSKILIEIVIEEIQMKAGNLCVK